MDKLADEIRVIAFIIINCGFVNNLNTFGLKKSA